MPQYHSPSDLSARWGKTALGQRLEFVPQVVAWTSPEPISSFLEASLFKNVKASFTYLRLVSPECLETAFLLILYRCKVYGVLGFWGVV